MKQSKLLQMLRTFNRIELNQLHTYLQSPFFNTNQNVLHLFQLLAAEYPTYAATALHKDHLFEQLFPKQKFSDTKMRLLMSKLTKLVEGFLVQQQFKEQTQEQDYLLLTAYGERHLDKLFNSQLQKAQKKLQQLPAQDVQFYYQQYLLEEASFQFDVFTKSRPVRTSLQAVLDNFDTYYIANKLRYYCAILNRQNILAVKHQLFLFEEIITQLKDSDYLKIPIIQFYYQALLLFLEEKEEAHFTPFKQWLAAKQIPLTEFDLRQLYGFALNYCSRKIKVGDMRYYPQLFDLYQLMLNKQLLVVGQYISPNHYTNIVKIGLISDKMDWVRQFIKDYASKLRPNVAKGVVDYNWVVVAFFNGEYEQVIQQCLFNIALIKDPFALISYKKLLLQSYYELNDTGNLDTLAVSFKMLLKRNKKISPFNQIAYRHFINYTMGLYNIKQNWKVDLPTWEQKIQEAEQLVDKWWLMNKVRELQVS